jgi:hypothetical protein
LHPGWFGDGKDAPVGSAHARQAFGKEWEDALGGNPSPLDPLRSVVTYLLGAELVVWAEVVGCPVFDLPVNWKLTYALPELQEPGKGIENLEVRRPSQVNVPLAPNE